MCPRSHGELQDQDGDPGPLSPSSVFPECRAPPTFPYLPSFPTPVPSTVPHGFFIPTHSKTTAWEAGHVRFSPQTRSSLENLRISPLALRESQYSSEPQDPLQGEQAEIQLAENGRIQTRCPVPHTHQHLRSVPAPGPALLLPPSPQRTLIFHSAEALERMRMCVSRMMTALARLPVGKRGTFPQPSVHMA